MMKAQPLITVADVDASAAFYCGLLGAQCGHGAASGEAAHGTYDYEQILVDGEMILQIHAFAADAHHESLGDETAALGNGVVMWFKTDDFESVLERIRERGILLDREPTMNPFARQMECWLHDPDGYRVVIAGPSAYEQSGPDR